MAKRRHKPPRKGTELHSAGLIWEGSAAEFSRIILGVKQDIESMSEAEKQLFYQTGELPPKSE